MIDFERAARVIRELEPDIVALQEIDSAVERSSRVDQATRLGELTNAQASGLVDIYRDETTPVILAGDFNPLPDSDVLALLKQHWHVPAKGEDRLTYPSDVPEREIDYIMYRPADRFEVVEHKVLHEPLVSDHRPVLIELRILNPANRN
ncbi:MAG: hypothetical protein GTO46_07255 [Gemmatimonadetes bacterium]|nr:hypothetical protein [Gemmatimonadota bacterium]NIO31428.1 hypothetical protein [Gemmatimonadota bacterium]